MCAKAGYHRYYPILLSQWWNISNDMYIEPFHKNHQHNHFNILWSYARLDWKLIVQIVLKHFIPEYPRYFILIFIKIHINYTSNRLKRQNLILKSIFLACFAKNLQKTIPSPHHTNFVDNATRNSEFNFSKNSQIFCRNL